MIQWILRQYIAYHLVSGPLEVAHAKAQGKVHTLYEVLWAIRHSKVSFVRFLTTLKYLRWDHV